MNSETDQAVRMRQSSEHAEKMDAFIEEMGGVNSLASKCRALGFY